MFFYEIKKITRQKELFVIIGIFFASLIGIIFFLSKNIENYREQNRRLIEIINGENDNIDKNLLRKKIEELESVAFSEGEYDSVKEKAMSDYLVLSYYERILKYQNNYENKLRDYLVELVKKESYYKSMGKDRELLITKKTIELYNRKFDLKLVNTKSYEAHFDFFYQGTFPFYISILLFLVCIMITARMVTLDKNTESSDMISTTKNGQIKYRMYKILALLLLFAILNLIVFLLN